MISSVARQQLREQRQRPGLERLGQQRVVRVRERALRELPRLVPVEAVLVDEQAHELGDRERRVRVVELRREQVRKLLERSRPSSRAGGAVLERAGDEEVLLLETQLLAAPGSSFG